MIAKKTITKSPVRRALVGGSIAVVAGLGMLAGTTGAAFAAAPDISTSTSTSTDTTVDPGPRGGMGGHGALDGVSTAVVQATDGTLSTQVRAGGDVTAVSDTAITVTSSDGTETTFTVPATVDVSTIAVGDTVQVRGTQSAGLNTAEDIHTAPADGEKPAKGERVANSATARPAVLHEATTGTDADGNAVNRSMQTGVITAVTDTTISVKSADDYHATYTLADGVTTTARVGDTVTVLGSGTDGSFTAERVATAAEMEALKSSGRQSGQGGERPDEAASSSPTTQNGANIPDASTLLG